MWTTFWNNFQYTFARGSPFKKLLFEASIKFRNKYSIKCQKIRVCSKNKGTLFLWKNESIMEINNLSWILQFDNAVCKFKIFETINTTKNKNFWVHLWRKRFTATCNMPKSVHFLMIIQHEIESTFYEHQNIKIVFC